MSTFSSFGSSEWLRLVFTVLICIPLLVIGGYLFGLLSDVITGKDGKRKRTTDVSEYDTAKPNETNESEQSNEK